MRARRLIATGMAVLATAVGAGCSAAAGEPIAVSPVSRPPATIPADPVAALAAAKARLGTESARFAQDDGGPRHLGFTGVANAETHNWEITAKEYVVRRVGTDLYIQASGEILESMMLPAETTDRLAAGGWVHTRLPNGRELSAVFNDKFPWNLANAVTLATGVIRISDRSFAGKIPGAAKPGSPPAARKDLRLSADLDEQGRFTKISVSADPSHGTVFTFSDFGVRADITAPPPGEVAEEENPSFTASLPLY